MSELKKLLGKRIREIRQSRNFTQEKLSELTEIGASSISKIESGYFHPTDDNLEKIATALNVEPYQLYMYNAHKEPKELIEAIKNMLKNATDEEIRLAYKILSGIFY